MHCTLHCCSHVYLVLRNCQSSTAGVLFKLTWAVIINFWSELCVGCFFFVVGGGWCIHTHPRSSWKMLLLVSPDVWSRAGPVTVVSPPTTCERILTNMLWVRHLSTKDNVGVCARSHLYTCKRMVPVVFFNSDTAWLWAMPSVDVSQIDMILSPTCHRSSETKKDCLFGKGCERVLILNHNIKVAWVWKNKRA